MTLWYCENCSLLDCEDCGPWSDQNKFFSNIKRAHKGHIGFKIGEPKIEYHVTEIEREFTDFFNEHIDELYRQLISQLKGPDKMCLIKEKWKWVSET